MKVLHPDRPYRLLLVDDDRVVRATARRVLAPQGFEILEADSGASALEVAAAAQGPIDLLVTDVVMPSVRGPALAAQLRISHPELRVLYMSGYGPESLGQDVVGEHDRFLQKPFTFSTLRDSVERALHGRGGP